MQRQQQEFWQPTDIKVRIYDALMPVPALSFATRYYKCNAGVMVTASHNPAKYNGYKAYGPDGCQMTDDAAAIVYAEIQKTDVLTGAKYMSFAEGVEKGLIRFVGDDCKKALYEAIESTSGSSGSLQDSRTEAGIQPAEWFRTCSGNTGIKGHRNHRYHNRSGTGISKRILHDLQLPEPGNFCSSGAGTEPCKGDRMQI